jgi:hypothetical protein
MRGFAAPFCDDSDQPSGHDDKTGVLVAELPVLVSVTAMMEDGMCHGLLPPEHGA